MQKQNTKNCIYYTQFHIARACVCALRVTRVKLSHLAEKQQNARTLTNTHKRTQQQQPLSCFPNLTNTLLCYASSVSRRIKQTNKQTNPFCTVIHMYITKCRKGADREMVVLKKTTIPREVGKRS